MMRGSDLKQYQMLRITHGPYRGMCVLGQQVDRYEKDEAKDEDEDEDEAA